MKLSFGKNNDGDRWVDLFPDSAAEAAELNSMVRTCSGRIELVIHEDLSACIIVRKKRGSYSTQWRYIGGKKR